MNPWHTYRKTTIAKKIHLPRGLEFLRLALAGPLGLSISVIEIPHGMIVKLTPPQLKLLGQLSRAKLAG
jgi:hypothetical protein